MPLKRRASPLDIARMYGTYPTMLGGLSGGELVEQTDVGGSDPADSGGLADGTRPDLEQFLSGLKTKTAHGLIIKSIWYHSRV